MKCSNCGKEYSDKVYRLHMERCKLVNEAIDLDKSLDEMTVEELKALAKSKGIKGYANMKKETLINKLSEQ